MTDAGTSTSSLPVCDLHCDTVLELQGGASFASNPGGHVDIARLKRGHVGLQVFACFTPSLLSPSRAHQEANALVDVLESACRRHPDDVRLVNDAGGVRNAIASGQIAAMRAIESGHAIAGDLGNLEQFRARGVRYLTLTHARHLEWAASSGEDWSQEYGLTGFGEEVIREMNRLGLIVDVSHVHERTFWDVARVARRPFIASHSCAAAICAVGRNLTDDQLRAVAASGGVVGLNFYPGFLDPDYHATVGTALPEMFRQLEEMELKYADDPPGRQAATRELSESILRRVGPPKATIETVVDHLEHLTRVMGDDYVAFGSDFDGVPWSQVPQGVPDCSAFPQILERMAARGFRPESLQKIAWGNFMRVLGDNE
jgi:membrane dipeptidase